ncbi:hypothetical protein B0H17DRAFT_1216193 [Mycena rosella]|uniref:Uncharacterized protein n=1 Tax=Mycena rosella TaxID=1033263 RepID=A0AAD7FTY9_MYCRO|nr:hypothetical protein B0H17DRAFT_1216193 [Mycena rosella]
MFEIFAKEGKARLAEAARRAQEDKARRAPDAARPAWEEALRQTSKALDAIDERLKAAGLVPKPAGDKAQQLTHEELQCQKERERDGVDNPCVSKALQLSGRLTVMVAKVGEIVEEPETRLQQLRALDVPTADRLECKDGEHAKTIARIKA